MHTFSGLGNDQWSACLFEKMLALLVCVCTFYNVHNEKKNRNKNRKQINLCSYQPNCLMANPILWGDLWVTFQAKGMLLGQ